MAEASRADRTRAALEAFSAGDIDALTDHLTDDVVWHVGGDHPLSGDYRGRDDVRAYHARVAELTDGTLHLEPIDVLTSDRYMGMFVRAAAQAGERTLDTTLVEAVRLDEEGRWREFWALAEDQAAVDDFWREVTR
jgi:ketosteroid isomerase-like protein